MEEMHRTHKEPVWGWVDEIALIARTIQRRQPRRWMRPLPIPMEAPQAGLGRVECPARR